MEKSVPAGGTAASWPNPRAEQRHGTIFARREAMQAFPLFFSLNDRRVLVVGGTDHAARKIELLLAAGAKVAVVAETVTGEVAQFIAERQVNWAGRGFCDAQLAGVSLVFVASDDEPLQEAVSRIAQARSVPVNVVDRPALSSFLMPAIIDRGLVTVAISTGGTAPALARKLRAEIERMLPAALGRVARFADMFRDQVRRTLRDPQARRHFWDHVFDGRVAAIALAGDETGARRELIRLLDAARSADNPFGMVHHVDAGPGDPDLLTLKAHRLLQRADVIVYDQLVSPEVLAMARRDAERLFVGKRKDFPCLAKDEIDRRLIALAHAGKTVVWLQGDAAVFDHCRV
jgi:uroporphyrin-III C-methyltransferase/precorrin-2 dehydrogenase/sirohydrochlorin ferrochelatase